MRKKICVYKTCRSDSRYADKPHMRGVFFLPFPKYKTNPVKCKKWIDWLGRMDYPLERVNSDTYLCSKHFVGGNGPTTSFPDPVHNQKKYVSILKYKLPLETENNNSFPASTSHSNLPIIKETSQSVCRGTQNVSLGRGCYLIPISVNHLESQDTSVEPEVVTRDVSYATQIDHFINGIHPTSAEKKNEVQQPLIMKLEVFNECNKVEESHDKTTMSENHQHSVVNSVEELFTDFLPPFYWSICRLKDGFKIMKVKETGVPLFGFTIDKSFNILFEALGSVITDEIILSKLPKQIQTPLELQTLLVKLCTYKTCCGNGEIEYMELFKRNSSDGFICSITNSVHSRKCILLVRETNRKRCFYCTKQRACFRVICRRQEKKNTLTKTHFRNLSKPELINTLKESRKNEFKLKAEIKRLRIKLLTKDTITD